ncbi:hypothetical protein QBC45DRAFT_232012 [Copromyces sp. CBS 386.78]|nr:hypothetical protein QBC45DRAFT_232012 [Copromyces sp. CBS 386.78]
MARRRVVRVTPHHLRARLIAVRIFFIYFIFYFQLSAGRCQPKKKRRSIETTGKLNLFLRGTGGIHLEINLHPFSLSFELLNGACKEEDDVRSGPARTFRLLAMTCFRYRSKKNPVRVMVCS